MGVGKCAFSQQKTSHISPFSDEIKIIELGWPWRSVLEQKLYKLYYVLSSKSWAFLLLLYHVETLAIYVQRVTQNWNFSLAEL